uniref:Cysteine protease S273R homolog protein n=1 Tax=Abalone asfa-like virus TaxID=2839893 RepID=A0A5K7XZC6_9VIRU|nr:cysteine protease S273R homolog protein [Abalone asfa-like virus]BCY04625.1 Putative cysteine protease [Abalone asfa-like virus]
MSHEKNYLTEIFSLITTNSGECVGNGANCLSKETASLLSDFLKYTGPDPIKHAKNHFSCKTETCVINQPSFIDFLKNKTTSDQQKKIRQDILSNIKLAGPRNSMDLLTNTQIDNVLNQWAAQFPDFYNCPFAMIDFAETNDDLNRIDFEKVYNGEMKQKIFTKTVTRPCKTFGCVLNTDVSTGVGKHWVCLFIDMRSEYIWTIEYFNSSGRAPPKEMIKFMSQTRNKLQKFANKKNIKVIATPVTDIVHQQSKSECGPYTLFYIRARLENVPYQYFSTNQVPDEFMVKFRKHLFLK